MQGDLQAVSRKYRHKDISDLMQSTSVSQSSVRTQWAISSVWVQPGLKKISYKTEIAFIYPGSCTSTEAINAF